MENEDQIIEMMPPPEVTVPLARGMYMVARAQVYATLLVAKQQERIAQALENSMDNSGTIVFTVRHQGY